MPHPFFWLKGEVNDLAFLNIGLVDLFSGPLAHESELFTSSRFVFKDIPLVLRWKDLAFLVPARQGSNSPSPGTDDDQMPVDFQGGGL